MHANLYYRTTLLYTVDCTSNTTDMEDSESNSSHSSDKEIGAEDPFLKFMHTSYQPPPSTVEGKVTRKKKKLSYAEQLVRF